MTPQQPAVQLQNVGLRRGETWILRHIDWSIPVGCCAAILGPNGSGKSTLARILACHLWPSEGEVRVLGGHFGESELAELRKTVRLVQSAGPCDVDPELTARQAVLTGFFGTLGLYDPVPSEMLERADRILAQIGLSALAEHRYATLSSGERVRCLIGRALVRPPRLLILDEPTAGLDLLAREQVLATIQRMFELEENPPTTIIITHHVEELPPAMSQMLLLCNGSVAASGSPRDVLQSEILSRVYRCPVDVRMSNGRYYLEVHPDAWEQLLK